TDETVSTAAAATIGTMKRFGMVGILRREEMKRESSRSRNYLTGWAAGAGAGGAPVPSVCPPGRITLLRRPTGAPPLTGCRVTVTSSPALNDVRAHPRAVMSVGLLTSTAQFRTVPVSSLASNFRKQWGFAQIHSVTGPFNVSSLVVSKLAAPWCATSGTETAKTANA